MGVASGFSRDGVIGWAAADLQWMVSLHVTEVGVQLSPIGC